jgi:tetratricopeptide (TPR) repeat protein
LEGTGATKAVIARPIDVFDQYAATYVALECLSGVQLTSEGFRSFVVSTLGYQSDRLALFAHDAIQKLIQRSEARDKSGLSFVEEVCERPYLYPVTGAEVTLAVGLNLALTMGCIPRDFQDGLASVVERRAAQWFIDEDKGESLLAALGGTSGNCLPPPLPIIDVGNKEALEAIRLHAQDAVDFNNRGLAYATLGQHTLAIRDYDEAIRIAPGYAEAYYNRGLAYYYLGPYERLSEDYLEATRLDPRLREAFNYGDPSLLPPRERPPLQWTPTPTTAQR